MEDWFMVLCLNVVGIFWWCGLAACRLHAFWILTLLKIPLAAFLLVNTVATIPDFGGLGCVNGWPATRVQS